MIRIVDSIGKSKILYAGGGKNLLVMKFIDTVHGGGKEEKVPGTGTIRADICETLFETLENNHIATHFVRRISKTEFLVRKLTMYKMEIVIRNIAAGSLVKQYPYNLGDPIHPPLVNFHLKLGSDPLLTPGMASSLGIAHLQECETLQHLARSVNSVLCDFLRKKHIVLVDFKFEAGKNEEGAVIIGDEISCDAARMWDEKTYQSLDKDVFRTGKGDLLEAYQLLRKKILSS